MNTLNLYVKGKKTLEMMFTKGTLSLVKKKNYAFQGINKLLSINVGI
jgi:hypothetical protein